MKKPSPKKGPKPGEQDPTVPYAKGTYDHKNFDYHAKDDLLDPEKKVLSADQIALRIKDPESNLSKKASARARADLFRKPEFQGALVQSRFGESVVDGLDVNWLVSRMEEANRRINSGDLGDVETMLFSQAEALSAVFVAMAARAQLNIGHNIDVVEQYMRMALRAQSQCRSTLETLAEVKNPKSVAFVRQANIANGPQQVNNGAGADAVSGAVRAPAFVRAEETITPTKQLEHVHGERLDVGAPGQAGRTHQDLVPVGAVDRAQDGAGQSPRVEELLPRSRAA